MVHAWYIPQNTSSRTPGSRAGRGQRWGGPPGAVAVLLWGLSSGGTGRWVRLSSVPPSSPALFLSVLSPVPALGSESTAPGKRGGPSGAGCGLPLPDRSGHWALKGDLGPEVGEKAHPGERGRSGNSEGPSWLQRVGRWDLPQPPAPGLQGGWEGGGAERVSGGAGQRGGQPRSAELCRGVGSIG